MTNVIPATREAVRQVYGDKPVRSFRGFTFERESRVIGCAGFYLDGSHVVMFFNGDHEEMKKDLRAVVVSGRAILELAKQKGLPVYADAEPKIPGSERLLEFLGFKRDEGTVFKWQG